MSGRAFIDTDALVCLFDADTPGKQQRAPDLLTAGESSSFVISTQVLAEFYVTVTRKLAEPLPVATAREAVEQLTRFAVVSTDARLVRSAVDTSIDHQLSLWDALILEAAAAADCDVLLSEDLSAGSTLRGVRIENPFAAGP